MNLFYLPYSIVSMSVKELQNVLGGQKIKTENSHYVPKKQHLVVNWGHGSPPSTWWDLSHFCPNLLNHWDSVALAVNKITAFKKFKEAGVPTPEWTTSHEQAKKWSDAGKVVICRTKISSMEGRGIVVATKPEELVSAPLYTKLFPKDKEYRVHVFNGKVIDYVQKKLKADAKEIKGRNEYIRNTANGWIFARNGVSISTEVEQVAKAAIKACGLDFGAVDLAVNKSGKVVVFEINTAPGLEGTTITCYTDAIKIYKTQLEKKHD